MKTISYKLAKQIHDAAEEKGINLPESECAAFKYIAFPDTNLWEIHKRGSIRDYHRETSIGCFSTDELLETLPRKLYKNSYCFMLKMLKGSMFRDMEEFECYIFYYYNPKAKDMFNTDNLRDEEPSEALGQLYLHLIKEELIK